ncbi:MAG: adenylate/guanylate cyclase domain-containing protein [Gammaproteobacteria bacterium]|nr:adenylate/guanylate cyclase domain-containing protein [Gammaproteobacteria bacterium]
MAKIFEDSEQQFSQEESQFVTVLIADLRGFTAMVDKVSSANIINMLNEFFGAMVEIIDQHGGHVNKFMGDSILTFFEDTRGVQNSVLNVLHCAIEMQIAMDKVNLKSAELGLDNLYMGIGINTGDALGSVLGSSIYREYTMIGTTVNLASRIEAYTLRGQILISEYTREHAGVFIETGMENEVNAKGMAHPLQLYELLSISHPEKIKLPVRDNRRALRIKISLPVSYQLLDGKSVLPDVYEGHVVDISYGGMMINTPIPMNQYSDIKMKVNLSPLMTEPVDIYAKALYVQQKGEATEVGLAFTIIDDATSAAVKSFVDNMV